MFLSVFKVQDLPVQSFPGGLTPSSSVEVNSTTNRFRTTLDGCEVLVGAEALIGGQVLRDKESKSGRSPF
ncbi:glycoside hydrolase family 12 protein [Moniliophthora roreri]|nr:glycoside hydrolase family 12 protein [Moniliophthora roreri]